MSVDLEGRSVLVTGAGAGIGQGIALAAGRAGAHVGVATRTENGREVVAEIEARGGRATWLRCDVVDADQVSRAVADFAGASGAIHAVVHNAVSNRSSQPHRIEHVDPELWEAHISVSLRGAYNLATAALPALAASHGTFLLMTSPAGVEGSATLPLYATVKGALRGFAKSLAREWGPLSVTVNVISPLGYSPAIEKAVAAEPAMAERLARRVPIGRLGDAETDVGDGVTLFLAAEARYITGQTIGVDGGHFMSI